MPAKTLKSAIEEGHAALDAILKGDESGYRNLYSEQEDVTLGNPFGPFARGRRTSKPHWLAPRRIIVTEE